MFLARLLKPIIGVFGNDFATVDFARNYATIATRKSKFGRFIIKTLKPSV